MVLGLISPGSGAKMFILFVDTSVGVERRENEDQDSAVHGLIHSITGLVFGLSSTREGGEGSEREKRRMRFKKQKQKESKENEKQQKEKKAHKRQISIFCVKGIFLFAASALWIRSRSPFACRSLVVCRFGLILRPYSPRSLPSLPPTVIQKRGKKIRKGHTVVVVGGAGTTEWGKSQSYMKSPKP